MLEIIKNTVWSPITVLNLAVIGIVILIRSRFYVVRKLPTIIKSTLLSITKNRRAFSLMCTSLGGTIGVGNAVGIAGAITDGGPGAVFWMGIASIIGMCIKHTEVYFSMIYKTPLGYMEKCVGSRALAQAYAFMCIFVSFGMGNLSQVKTALSSAEGVITISPLITAALISILFLAVVSGGIDKIRKFSEITIPIFSLAYIILLITILFKNSESIGGALNNIFSSSGIMGGIKWSLIKSGITSGFSKAIFSSEAGLGSAGFTHSESDASPNEQAKWGVIEVMVDSLICIITGIVLLISFEGTAMPSESKMVMTVFINFFGKLGGYFYSISMIFFAFSSVICWYYNGLCSVRYLNSKKKFSSRYKVTFASVIILAAFVGESYIYDISDIANGLMMSINLFALWIVVFKNSLTFL